MPINLTKGQKVDLTKGNPGLSKIVVGLGWDVNAFDSGAAFDLDAAAFMVAGDGKCPTEKEFVFYGNLEHQSGAVKHMGDNLTGEGDGDDEQITIELAAVPANVERIACDSSLISLSFSMISSSVNPSIFLRRNVLENNGIFSTSNLGVNCESVPITSAISLALCKSTFFVFVSVFFFTIIKILK